MGMKDTIKQMPVLGRAATLAAKAIKRPPSLSEFAGSAEYWDKRYRTGGNSGAGSYNRLAHFKAEFLNRFVSENDVRSVIELGSGDGAQLELAEYPSYLGVDVSRTIVEEAKKKFSDDARISFVHSSELTGRENADLSLSLDVIYHLVEDDVFNKYMKDLFGLSTKFVIIYSSNEDKPWPSPHVRHRQFTRWVEGNRSDFTLIDHVPNAYPADSKDPDNTSFADFYVFRKTIAA